MMVVSEVRRCLGILGISIGLFIILLHDAVALRRRGEEEGHEQPQSALPYVSFISFWVVYEGQREASVCPQVFNPGCIYIHTNIHTERRTLLELTKARTFYRKRYKRSYVSFVSLLWSLVYA